MATFFFKLVPPRLDFRLTMTPDERAVMQRHVGYWAEKQKDGKAPVFGPVFDSQGDYGIAVVTVETEAEAQALRAADPVVVAGLHREEIYPMRAVIEGRPEPGPLPSAQRHERSR